MLLEELWHILSRKQPKRQSIKILNLKTIVTAILSFAIMVVDSKKPYSAKIKPKRNFNKEFRKADNFCDEDLEEGKDGALRHINNDADWVLPEE